MSTLEPTAAPGCAYGMLTRERIDELRKEYDDHDKKQNSSLEKVWTELRSIRQEISSRLPLWATLLISILASTSTGMAVYFFTH